MNKKGIILTDYKFWNGAIEKLYQLNKLLKFDFYVVSERFSSIYIPKEILKPINPRFLPELLRSYEILFTVDRTIEYARFFPRKSKHIHYWSTFLSLRETDIKPSFVFTASKYILSLGRNTFYLGPIIDLKHPSPKRNSKHRILFIGSFYRDDIKNVLFLEHLAETFPDVEFLVVGKGTEKLKNLPNLKKLGYLLRPYHLFRKASIFILPSKKDTNPLSIYHALVNGLQVLTVPIPQVLEEVGEFIKVSSLDYFTEELENLLREQPKLNYEASNFCRRKYSLENYRWAIELILEGKG